MKTNTKSAKKEADFNKRQNHLRVFWLFKLGALCPDDVPEGMRAEVDAAIMVVYFMTEKICNEICRIKGFPDLAYQAWGNTYESLSKANFRGDSLLTTFTRSVARNEISDLIKKELTNPNVELEDDFAIVCQVLSRLLDDKLMADIIAGKPNLQREIIKTIINYENNKKGRDAVPSKEKVIAILVMKGHKRQDVKNSWDRLREKLAKDYHINLEPPKNKDSSGENSLEI